MRSKDKFPHGLLKTYVSFRSRVAGSFVLAAVEIARIPLHENDLLSERDSARGQGSGALISRALKKKL